MNKIKYGLMGILFIFMGCTGLNSFINTINNLLPCSNNEFSLIDSNGNQVCSPCPDITEIQKCTVDGKNCACIKQ